VKKGPFINRCLSISNGKISIYEDGELLYIYTNNEMLTKEEISQLFNDPLCIFKMLAWWQRWKLKPRNKISRKIHQIKRVLFDWLNL